MIESPASCVGGSRDKTCELPPVLGWTFQSSVLLQTTPIKLAALLNRTWQRFLDVIIDLVRSQCPIWVKRCFFVSS